MGYTSQQSLVCDNSSTANFNAWCGAISAALAAAGWTKTTDTGQVSSWGSVAVPSSAYVYEIWQPADALQTGSTKFFIKVEYGYSSTAPGLRITIGTGTNGSGSLTGPATVGYSFNNGGNWAGGASNQGSTGYECDFSGDTNRFHMMLWRNNNSVAPVIFSFERTKNVDGSDSSDGVVFYAASKSGGGHDGNNSNAPGLCQVLGLGLAGAAQAYLFPCFAPVNFSSSGGQLIANAFNGGIAVSPQMPEYGKIGNPLAGICYVTNVTEGSQFQTTLYGATRTYIATSNLSSNAFPANARTGMRYD